MGFVVDEIFYVAVASNVGFFFTFREENKVTHSLTDLASPLGDSFVWKDSFSNYIIYLIYNDCLMSFSGNVVLF